MSTHYWMQTWGVSPWQHERGKSHKSEGFGSSESTQTRSDTHSFTLPRRPSDRNSPIKLTPSPRSPPLEVAVHQRSGSDEEKRASPRFKTVWLMFKLRGSVFDLKLYLKACRALCVCARVCVFVYDWWDHRRKRFSPHLDVYLSCQLVSTKAAQTRLLGSAGRGEAAAVRRFIFTSTPPCGGGGKWVIQQLYP